MKTAIEQTISKKMFVGPKRSIGFFIFLVDIISFYLILLLHQVGLRQSYLKTSTFSPPFSMYKSTFILTP